MNDYKYPKILQASSFYHPSSFDKLRMTQVQDDNSIFYSCTSALRTSVHPQKGMIYVKKIY